MKRSTEISDKARATYVVPTNGEHGTSEDNNSDTDSLSSDFGGGQQQSINEDVQEAEDVDGEESAAEVVDGEESAAEDIDGEESAAEDVDGEESAAEDVGGEDSGDEESDEKEDGNEGSDGEQVDMEVEGGESPSDSSNRPQSALRSLLEVVAKRPDAFEAISVFQEPIRYSTFKPFDTVQPFDAGRTKYYVSPLVSYHIYSITPTE